MQRYLRPAAGGLVAVSAATAGGYFVAMETAGHLVPWWPYFIFLALAILGVLGYLHGSKGTENPAKADESHRSRELVDQLAGAERSSPGVPSTAGPRRHAGQARPPNAGLADGAGKDQWVAAVMAFADIEDPEFRRAVLREMGDLLRLNHSFLASYRGVARDHVIEIVARCWDFKDRDAALDALAGALTSLRPDDRAADEIQKIRGNH